MGTFVSGTSPLFAFPLTLASANGTITSTETYGLDAVTTSNRAPKVAVTLIRILTVLSNEVFLNTGTNPPADMKIALEPTTTALYLTNSSGFFYDIEGNGLGDFRIREMATTFLIDGAAILEKDAVLADLEFRGNEPGGGFFEFRMRGYGTLLYKLSATGSGLMIFSVKKGSGYGEYNSSDSGVSLGSFKAQGAGTPEWSGPFSVYWWNN